MITEPAKLAADASAPGILLIEAQAIQPQQILILLLEGDEFIMLLLIADVAPDSLHL
jgi:hypothetical protein